MSTDIYKLTIVAGLGDTIAIRSKLDQLIPKVKEIQVSYSRFIIDTHLGVNNDAYYNFIKEYGKLFFGAPPYVITDEQFPFRTVEDLYIHGKLAPIVTDYGSILCDPNYTHNFKKYIVVNTKLRIFRKADYLKLKAPFFSALRLASKKYMVVVLGERQLEYNKEYNTYGTDLAYTIYNDILENIPTNRIVDMTVDVRGKSIPSLDKIRKDCCILRDAAYSVTIGYGGQFCLSMATAGKHIALCQQHSEHTDVGEFLISQKNNRFLATDNVDEFLKILVKEST